MLLILSTKVRRQSDRFCNSQPAFTLKTMQLFSDHLYHIYNQGNNQETIFYTRADYLHFLQQVRDKVLPHCEIVTYCLMPNHFHFLVNTTKNSTVPVKLGQLTSTALNNGFRLLLSGYANEFNKKYGRTGSLFRQKTKFKNLENEAESSDNNYPFVCFHYIHQNPFVANLCPKMEDWEFSSFRDYLGIRNGTLITKRPAYDLIGISLDGFYEESYQFIGESRIKHLYDE